MFRIHDVMSGWDGLDLPGLPYYADRALILSGTAVVRDGAIDDYLAYLTGVGIGAGRVFRVAHDWLVRAAADDPEVVAAIADHVRRGGKLQFFSATACEQRLLGMLGLDWSETFSAPPDLTAYASCKAELRRLGAELGMTEAFPRHRLCRAKADVHGAVRDILSGRCDFAVLKRPDLASGDGMALVPRGRTERAVEDYWNRHAGREIIVEAGHEHVPMSVQWEIHDAGPAFVGATAQLIEEPFTHCGNVIASAGLPDVSAGDVRKMKRLSLPFVRRYRGLGYRGVCGFDFMRTRSDGHLYLLECNGRVTASTYAIGVARQITERLPDWAIVMSNIKTAGSVRTFAEVRRRLGDSLYGGLTGVLPFNVRCLELDDPKIAACCIGRDAAEARRFLAEAVRLLG